MKNIRYIATKFRNDAAETLDTANYKLSVENYENFKKTIRILDPSYGFVAEDVEFYRAIAGVYSQLSENGTPEEKDRNFSLSKESYEKAIMLDTTDISSNYNIGVLYYNRAGHLILDMEYGEIEELDKIQDKTVALLKEASPYMLRSKLLIDRKYGEAESYKDSRCIDVLEALHNIYLALHEDEKAKQIEELIKKLKLQKEGK